jgi:hypothetical protein
LKKHEFEQVGKKRIKDVENATLKQDVNNQKLLTNNKLKSHI